MLLSAALTILSLIGFLISLYFALVYYRKIPANYFLVPRFCRMKESTCQTVLSTREARVFGVPNFLLGFGYYALVFLAAISTSDEAERVSHTILLLFSILALIFSVYLAYSLLFKIKIPCPLCFISQTLNLLLVVFLLLK